MIVTAHIKFSMSTTFLDNFFTAEDERLPGESIEDGVLRVRKHLENAVERLKKEQESRRGQVISETYSGVMATSPPIAPPMPLEINIQHERIQIGIENAATVEELKAVKADHPLMPASLMNAYNKKMEELSK